MLLPVLSRQSDLRAFLTKGSAPKSSPSPETMPPAKRTRSSASAEAPPSPLKKARTNGTSKSKSPEKETKPRIKKEEDEDDDGHDPRFRSVSTAAAEQIANEHFPEQMEETPIAKLYNAMRALSEVKRDTKPNKDGVVVYWSR